jgi:hypothetical protein
VGSSIYALDYQVNEGKPFQVLIFAKPEKENHKRTSPGPEK